MLRLKRILVPCDFSPFSEAAVSRACDLATMFESELHLLHVVGETPLLGSVEPEADRLRDGRQRLDQQVNPHLMVRLAVIRDVIVGTPHREISKYALDHDIDLVVMGTHGRTGLSHLAIGSVAERVLRAAPCPVLIVRKVEQENDLALAAKVLHDEFGSTLTGEFGDTRASLKGRLMRKLDITDQRSEFIVSNLMDNQTLTWEEELNQRGTSTRIGKWRIGAPDSPADASTPVFISREGISPALDLIARAVALRATDIHIDPAGREHAVRLRIDGRLERYCGLDSEVASHLIQQCKTMARLDIADPFHPQEGRMRLPPAFADLEVRITTSPVAAGESVALRLFDRDNVLRPLDSLGLSPASLAPIGQILRRGEGLVLVTGPTGSGKTTTVYSMLKSLGTGERNIVSIEDPVEFPATFVRQMEVDERHGVTMTSGLRTLLRMDPDIVFLGEIRDAGAAETAMRAASSGKYVFSTLHTRDVASTITALRDLHIDSRSLAGNLTGIISQRIVRRLCSQCRREDTTTDEQRALVKDYGLGPPAHLFYPSGCTHCRGTGYRGRIGVYEVVVPNDDILRQISSGASEQELRQCIRLAGTPDLMNDALSKVCDGITSLEEVMKMRSV